jgi:hypothetical protein
MLEGLKAAAVDQHLGEEMLLDMFLISAEQCWAIATQCWSEHVGHRQNFQQWHHMTTI